jgi:uncharacterized LabA/DUF88 family protein
LDIEKLLDCYKEDHLLHRAFCFTTYNQSPHELNRFTNYMQKLGVEVRAKQVKTLPDGSRKGDMDAELILAVVDLADQLDKVVLVTADGDFLPCVAWLQHRSKLVECVAHPSTVSRELSKAVDRFRPIKENLLLEISRNSNHKNQNIVRI